MQTSSFKKDRFLLLFLFACGLGLILAFPMRPYILEAMDD
jgi:hypothetical protein